MIASAFHGFADSIIAGYFTSGRLTLPKAAVVA
jgi:hypothetical protein